MFFRARAEKSAIQAAIQIMALLGFSVVLSQKHRGNHSTLQFSNQVLLQKLTRRKMYVLCVIELFQLAIHFTRRDVRMKSI